MTIFAIIFCSLALVVVIIFGIKTLKISREIDKILGDVEEKLDYMKKGLEL